MLTRLIFLVKMHIQINLFEFSRQNVNSNPFAGLCLSKLRRFPNRKYFKISNSFFQNFEKTLTNTYVWISHCLLQQHVAVAWPINLAVLLILYFLGQKIPSFGKILQKRFLWIKSILCNHNSGQTLQSAHENMRRRSPTDAWKRSADY
jgi:hypothetical protein